MRLGVMTFGHIIFDYGGIAMNKQLVTVVDAPHVYLAENENPGETLLKFFSALGWNGEDILNPCKIRTTKDVFNRLYDVMYERCLDSMGISILMVNSGPGVDDFVPPGKVYLYEGWITPPESKEGD